MTADTFADDTDDSGANHLLATVRTAPLTDRANCEPPILKGLTATETLVAALVFFPAWFLVGGALALLFRHWQILMLLGVIGPLASVWFTAGFFAGVKRNRPDHYYGHAVELARQRLGFKRATLLVRAGGWELGREMPAMAGSSVPLHTRIARSFGL
jgi:conjugative transfer region protein (TIGR03750 family)